LYNSPLNYSSDNISSVGRQINYASTPPVGNLPPVKTLSPVPTRDVDFTTIINSVNPNSNSSNNPNSNSSNMNSNDNNSNGNDNINGNNSNSNHNTNTNPNELQLNVYMDITPDIKPILSSPIIEQITPATNNHSNENIVQPPMSTLPGTMGLYVPPSSSTYNPNGYNTTNNSTPKTSMGFAYNPPNIPSTSNIQNVPQTSMGFAYNNPNEVVSLSQDDFLFNSNTDRSMFSFGNTNGYPYNNTDLEPTYTERRSPSKGGSGGLFRHKPGVLDKSSGSRNTSPPKGNLRSSTNQLSKSGIYNNNDHLNDLKTDFFELNNIMDSKKIITKPVPMFVVK